MWEIRLTLAQPLLLKRHERTYDSNIRKVYPGGIYRVDQKIFQRLGDQEIYVKQERRFYPYRATFDFESYFNVSSLLASSPKVDWLAC